MSTLHGCVTVGPPPPLASSFVTLPSGQRYAVIGIAQYPFREPTVMLTYRSQVKSDDPAAVRKETRALWRSFQLYAEEHGYTGAIVSAVWPASSGVISSSKSFNVAFEKKRGAWIDSNAPNRLTTLRGPMHNFAWILGTWHCTYHLADDNFRTGYRALQIYEIDPTGTAVEESDELFVPRGRIVSLSDNGYDARRRVWYDRNRQPHLTETDESRQPYSRSMTYDGVVREAGVAPKYGRLTIRSNPGGNNMQLRGVLHAGSAWRPIMRGDCSKGA